MKAELQQMQLTELRCVSEGQPNLQPGNICFVAMTAVDGEAIETTLGLRAYVWENSTEQLRFLIHFEVLWYASSEELEEAMTLGPRKNADMSSFVLGTRLLGGYIGTRHWLDVCRSTGRVLQPVLRLSRMLGSPTEVCFHKSLETGPLDVAAVISRCLEAATKAGRPSSWRLRTAWKDVQTKECFVLVSDSVMAQPETLKHLVEKASKEGKLGSPCSALHLFHQHTEWVS